jgi:hypothetical protein
MSIYTGALAARLAALAARETAREATSYAWLHFAPNARSAAYKAFNLAQHAYDTACAEVEAIEAAMECAL